MELKVGDYVRLTGPAWNCEEYGQSQGKIVRVDKISGAQAWSNASYNDDPNYSDYGSLTNFDGEPYGSDYAVELVRVIDPDHPDYDPVVSTGYHNSETANGQKLNVLWEENVRANKRDTDYTVASVQITSLTDHFAHSLFLSHKDLDDLITVLQYAKQRIEGTNAEENVG